MVANKTANSSTINGYMKFPKYRENKYGDRMLRCLNHRKFTRNITTRECVHLITGSYFRSRDKDGGHVIRSTVGLHAHFTALCVIDAE